MKSERHAGCGKPPPASTYLFWILPLFRSSDRLPLRITQPSVQIMIKGRIRRRRRWWLTRIDEQTADVNRRRPNISLEEQTSELLRNSFFLSDEQRTHGHADAPVQHLPLSCCVKAEYQKTKCMPSGLCRWYAIARMIGARSGHRTDDYG